MAVLKTSEDYLLVQSRSLSDQDFARHVKQTVTCVAGGQRGTECAAVLRDLYRYLACRPKRRRNCADTILGFEAALAEEQQGITFSLTIKFANFYHHWKTPNLDGLRRLNNSGVTLELLEGENKWTEFLNDEDFVRLRNDEKEELLNRAKSASRQNNEQTVKKIFNKNKLGNTSQPSDDDDPHDSSDGADGRGEDGGED